MITLFTDLFSDVDGITQITVTDSLEVIFAKHGQSHCLSNM